jgi:uncharacterized membrane protein YfcA
MAAVVGNRFERHTDHQKFFKPFLIMFRPGFPNLIDNTEHGYVMDYINVSPPILIILFFLVAFAYSSVGLGGGSSYTALMAIVGINTLAIPMISLCLNLIVTTVGSFNFVINKHARIGLILPFLISSIPMAYIGGSLKLPNGFFYWVLLVSLLFVVARIYFWPETTIELKLGLKHKIALSLLAGSMLGLVAGIVGIGGGIYLVPLILVLGLGTEKEAAACGAVFIWLNSMTGMIARLHHNSIDMTIFIPLMMAVIVGGAAGSFLGSFKFSPKMIEKTLGGILVVAVVLLSRKVIGI